ncbi:MAG: DNA polymerase/3'-5' exonuclease PolX [Ferruginibacter sp.]|nr:DNA polymerase/3'-5' exonuclease PolX [Bacteroidota bacterium]MBX2919461.1 DNA polymerase/3'-5' exonuclease PolX [Ferruginibacter sp.]
MDNYQIADIFSLLSKLMDIHQENNFKAKSYASAAFNIEKLPMQLTEMPKEKISEIRGIGESTASKIIEILETGELKALKELIEKTPVGVIEMLNLKGLGPKKISTIWKEMGIESIGELLYACRENRLKLYKGFGEKTQQNVIETIEFYLNNQGSHLYAQVEAVEPQITAYLQKLFSPQNIALTGNYKRQLEYVDELEYVVNSSNEMIKPKFLSAQPPELLEETPGSLLYKLLNGLKLRLYTGTANFSKNLFETSGSKEFIDAFTAIYGKPEFSDAEITDDKYLFSSVGINYIPPFLRETAKIIDKAKVGNLPNVIQPTDIKGIIHCHSNWSDGSNTLEDMANAAKEQGFEYLVISDHSKSAFYAQGLFEEKISAQHKLIDELNNNLTGFKIFKSIESDILYDGSLDYSNAVLATFDIVIASVHSILKMTEEKAMQRLIAAIENPYTTILGHMTGRLLLSRKGYPVNHKKIIDACAANNVVIELNAHPSRLDIDWRQIEYALEKNVLISINPDAHSIEGFKDIRYGVLVAQKAMVTKEQNLSSMNLQQFEEFVQRRKNSIRL